MNTAALTRALRKSNLPEYIILEKDRYGKTVRVQNGWYIQRENDHATIHHNALNNGMNWEYTHTERTTSQYHEYMTWLNQITAIITEAGYQFELVTSTFRFGTFKQHEAPIIRQIKITK